MSGNSVQKQYQNITDWLLAILEVVNAGSTLAPQRAIKMRMREVIDACGSEMFWQTVRQCSMTFGASDVLSIENLFQRCPNLPHLIETDDAGQAAIKQWFERNRAVVALLRKVSAAILKANPVIELQAEPSPCTAEGFTQVLDLLFHEGGME
jgi:hypothetical protein